MTSTQLDVVAIGDAIVDVIATCDDAFLRERELTKGSMQLLSTSQADDLYAAMGSAREISGGSAANSMAGVAALGLRSAFIGQVATDQLGDIFAHDMTALGVRFATPPLDSGLPTGRCLILVTPDAQRTMNTCPGASHELTVQALDEALIRSAAVTFLEGYLWGPERPREAMLAAAEIAHSSRPNGRLHSVRKPLHRPAPRRRVGDDRGGHVDLLFGNEDEVRHLTGCGSLADCLDALSSRVKTLVITRGAQGAVAVSDGATASVEAARAAKVVDTTGAGDLFAAGFIAAHCRGRDLGASLTAGSLAAAEVISHFGARPEKDLKEIVGL